MLRQIPEEPLQPVFRWARSISPKKGRNRSRLGWTAISVKARTRGNSNRRSNRAGWHDAVHLTSTRDFLLGPEAAHLNSRAYPGFAYQTSARRVAASRRCFKHFPDDEGIDCGGLPFNVPREPDLCYSDQPERVEQSDEALYEKLGVRAEAVRERGILRAPYTAKGLAPQHFFRNNGRFSTNVTPLTWDCAARCCSRGSAAQQG